VTSFLFPSLCRSCGVFVRNEAVFCQSCDEKISPISSFTLSVTTQFSIKIYAACAYEGPFRKLILRKNRSAFSSADRLASRQLAYVMCEKIEAIKTPLFWQKWSGAFPVDFIVPIPLHWTRYAKRGFNQSYEMARVVGERLDRPVLRLFQRSRRTKFQSRLSSSDRQENVKGVFKIRRKYEDDFKNLVYNKHILFVDDLCTTGATIKNVARVLLKAKPQSISAMVACRTV